MSGIYTEIHGSGPDLVLLHGWGLNLRVWDGLVQRLSDRFRLIAIDLPGHGRSEWRSNAHTPAAMAWQVLEGVGPVTQRFSLLGWSYGGQIALDLAASLPNKVERLCLVAATPKFVAAPDWPWGSKLDALERLTLRLHTDYHRTVNEFMELQVRGSADADKVLAQLRSSLFAHGEADPQALLTGLQTLRDTDLRAMLGMVRAPALVVAGQHDRVTYPAACQMLAKSLPNARYHEFPRAAHAPFLSHAAEFERLLAEFLQ